MISLSFTCLSFPEIDFHVLPRMDFELAPFLYQILIFSSIPQTWPLLLTDIWNKGSKYYVLGNVIKNSESHIYVLKRLRVNSGPLSSSGGVITDSNPKTLAN